MSAFKLKKECKKLYAALPYGEILLYKTLWFFWAFVMFDIWYSVSHDDRIVSKVKPWLLESVPAWFGLRGRWLLDISHTMWAVERSFIWDLMPWLCGHVIVGRAVKVHQPQLTSAFYTAETCLFFYHFSSAKGVIFLLLLPFTVFCVAKLFRVKMLVWILAALFVFENRLQWQGWRDFLNWLLEDLDSTTQFILRQSVAWGAMRCVSFGTLITEESSSQITLARAMGYYSYLPTIFLGPFHICEVYEKGLNSPVPPLNSSVILGMLLAQARFGFIFCIKHLMDHFIYVHAMSKNPDILRELDTTSLMAFGIYTLLNFSIMYVPVYGIPQSFMVLDGMEPTPYPRCLVHVYIYSECWRKFDVGFYVFVKRYIYVGLMRDSRDFFRQLIATSVVYLFVYLYHGASDALFYWTIFNFLQVITEASLLKTIPNWKCYRNFEASLSPACLRRLHACLALPSWFIGGLTLQYFFSDHVTVGHIFMERIFVLASWMDLAKITLWGYMGVQVAMEANNMIARKEIQRLLKKKMSSCY